MLPGALYYLKERIFLMTEAEIAKIFTASGISLCGSFRRCVLSSDLKIRDQRIDSVFNSVINIYMGR